MATTRLTTVSLTSAGATIDGDGAFDAASQRVTGTVRLNVGDLHDFADLAPGLRGQANAVAKLDGLLSGPAQIHVESRLDDLATGSPAVDALTEDILSVCSPTEIARVRKSLQALRGRLIENGY